MLGAFILDHLQPFKPFLFWQFSICFFFILGCQFCLPQRANSEKKGYSQLQKWMIQRGLSAWGIQTRPFAHLHFFKPILSLQFFNLFHLYTGMLGAFKMDYLQPFKHILYWQFSICFPFILGGNFLLPQRDNTQKGILSTQKWMRQRGLSALGIQIGPLVAL